MTTGTEQLDVSLSLDVITSFLKKELEKLASGDLFMSCGLEEKDLYELSTKDVKAKKKSKKNAKFSNEKYHTFFEYILTEMMENSKVLSHEPDKLRKKKLKSVLKSNQEKLEEEINNFVRDKLNSHSVTPSINEKKFITKENGNYNDHDTKEETIEDDAIEKISEETTKDEDSTSRKTKKKTKKKKSKKKKDEVALQDENEDERDKPDKENKELMNDLSFEQQEQLKRARRTFDEEKQKTLGSLPDDVIRSFRQIGFSKWSKDILPVIELSPYDVEPGDVRKQWMKMIKNTRRAKRPPTRLVMWYGTVWENRGQAYSFLPKKMITSYQNGVKKGYDQVPSKIQKKIEKGKELSINDQFIVQAFDQMKKDIELPPKDRIKWMMRFLEHHEVVDDNLTQTEEIDSKENITDLKGIEAIKKSTIADHIEEIEIKAEKAWDKIKEEFKSDSLEPSDISSPNDGSEFEEKEIKKIEIKKRKRKDDGKDEKQKKKKKVKEKFDDNKVNGALREDKESSVVKKKRKDKKRSIDLMSQENDIQKDGKNVSDRIKRDEDTDEKKKGGKIKKKAKTVKSEEKQRIADKDMTEEKVKKEVITDDDKEEKKKANKIKKKIKSGPLEEIQVISDEEVKRAKVKKEIIPESIKVKDAGSKGDKIPKKSKILIEDSFEHEQQQFERCEEIFIPLLRDMNGAVNGNDHMKTLVYLKKMKKKSSFLTKSFIENIKIGSLIKKAKRTFKTSHPQINEGCKEFSAIIKKIYSESVLPDGFKPKVKFSLELDSTVETAKEYPDDKSTASKKDQINEKTGSQTKEILGSEIVKKKISTSEDKHEMTTIPRKDAVKPKNGTNPLVINSQGHLSSSVNGSASTPPTPFSSESKKNKKRLGPLAALLEAPKKTSEVSKHAEVDSKKTLTPAAVMSVKKDPPKWLRGVTEDREDSEQLDPERMLALQFFEDALLDFPPEKVNISHAARTLEHTTKVYTERAKISYWDKVQDLCGALRSFHEGETSKLAKSILDGEFTDPMNLVRLSTRKLFQMLDCNV